MSEGVEPSTPSRHVIWTRKVAVHDTVKHNTSATRSSIKKLSDSEI